MAAGGTTGGAMARLPPCGLSDWGRAEPNAKLESRIHYKSSTFATIRISGLISTSLKFPGRDPVETRTHT